MHTGAKNMDAYEEFCSKFIEDETVEANQDVDKRFSNTLPRMTKRLAEEIFSPSSNISIIHVTEPLGSDYPILKQLHNTYELVNQWYDKLL